MTDETKAPPTARNDEETTRLATTLYEHVRQFNYATAGPTSSPSPALCTPSSATSAKKPTASIRSSTRSIAFLRELQADRLGHYQAGDLADMLSRHGQVLGEARSHTRVLCATLSDAQPAINVVHLGVTRGREAPPTVQGKAHGDDVGVAAAANDFPRPITDPTLLAPPPVGEPDRFVRIRRSNTPEA
ncbi:hypothetical protein ACLQ2P_31575 [Actinomadura citrea]|uniref:hypothetical protein n=1 Tax=Actinomadura citrea TaxID=46158 RepID=UPI003CE5168C